jgi:methylglutaconyl-CoA hydratase
MSEDMRLEGYIESRIDEGIGTITFYHPMSNSLPGRLLAQLSNAIGEMGAEPEVKVIVLQSEGSRVFCGGASFEELVSIENLEQGKEFFSGFARVINSMRKSPKLIIGRIQGKAVGGGVGLASATDYCFATKEAAIKLSELAVGIGPFVVGPAVERKVGLSAMSELAINATEWRSASWAREKGLYTHVYDTIEDMDQAIATLAARLSTSNPEAMEELKKIFWAGTEHWDKLLLERAGISGRLVLSDFTKNAIAKFKKK